MQSIPAELEQKLVGQLHSAGCIFAVADFRRLLEAAADEQELESFTSRRIAGESTDQIVGRTEFFGLKIELVRTIAGPDPGAELLVREAIARAKSGAVVVELECGSGALGIAVCSAIEEAELFATDSSPVAVANATSNFERFGGKAFLGELFEGLPEQIKGRVDILVVGKRWGATESAVLDPFAEQESRSPWEIGPGSRLESLVLEAPLWLSKEGFLFIEADEAVSDLIARIWARHGFQTKLATSPLFNSTVLIGQFAR